MNNFTYEDANGPDESPEREVAGEPAVDRADNLRDGQASDADKNTDTVEVAPAVPARPVALPVIFDNIPARLRALNTWVLWRYQWDAARGEYTKPPVQPNGYHARTNDASTWNSFEAVRAAYEKGTPGGEGRFDFDGVGLVLTEDDDVVGVDLDKQAGKFGQWSELALETLEAFDSYAERSPSGRGLRIFAVGAMEAKGHNNRKGVEIYRDAHFLTITGQQIAGTKATVEPAQAAIDDFIARHFPRNPSPAPKSPSLYSVTRTQEEEPAVGPDDALSDSPTPDIEPPRLKLSPNEIVPRARAAKNGHKFRDLYDFGDISDYNGDESSADFALCRLLAFWTGRRPDLIDQLFRDSALYLAEGRAGKWDRPCSGGLTYGGYTIKRVLASCTQFFGDQLPSPLSESDLPVTRNFSTDGISNGERFAAQHRHRARYCTPWKCWLVYDQEEGRWVRDECFVVDALAKLTARSIKGEAAGIEDEAKRDEMRKFAKVSTDRSRREKMLEDARSEDGMTILPNKLDLDTDRLNVLNGTIDLRSGKLFPHSPDDLISRLAPVEFDPNAKCPLFEKFLHGVFGGDKTVIGFVQRAFGSALTGDVGDQTVFMLLGGGSNGKSSLTQTIARILGSYAHETPPETFMERQNEKIATDIADLLGVRLVLTSESRRGQKLDEAKLKRITGGEKITGEYKYEHPFSFYPQFKLFLVTNHLPKIEGTEDAVWRRIAPLEFKSKFWNPDKGGSGPEHLRADKGMLQKLKAEYPGILNWLVQGCLRWREEGLRCPHSVLEMLAGYRAEQDELRDFMEECCTLDERAVTRSSVLYSAYQHWCLHSEREAMSEGDFGYKLTERGIVSQKGKGTDRNKRTRVGIALRDRDEIDRIEQSEYMLDLLTSSPASRGVLNGI